MPPYILLQFGLHIGLIQIFKKFLVSLPELRLFPQRYHAAAIVPGVVAVCEPASVKKVQEHLPVLRLHTVTVPSLLQIPVHVFAVNAHHARRISGALHSSLYLQGVHACLYDIGQDVKGAQILQAQHVSLAAFIERGWTRPAGGARLFALVPFSGLFTDSGPGSSLAGLFRHGMFSIHPAYILRLIYRVGKAAGLGAASPVSASAANKAAHKTLS